MLFAQVWRIGTAQPGRFPKPGSEEPLNSDEPSTLLVTRPLDEVREVKLARALGAKELSWTAGGTQYVLWVNGQVAKQFVQALPPAQRIVN